MNLTNYLLIFILCVGINANELKVNQSIDRSIEKCNKKALNGFLETLTPQDYEEAKLTDIYIRAKSFNQTFDKFERLQTFQQNISKSFEPILQRIIGRMTEVLMEIQLPNECMTALIKIATGAQNRKSWALNYMETLPSPVSGMIVYNRESGGYDECLEFKIPDYELNSGEEIIGQYCYLALPDLLGNEKVVLNDSLKSEVNQYINNSGHNKSPPESRWNKMSFTQSFFNEIIEINSFGKTFDTKLPIGICIPKTCKPQDIENAINKALFPITRLPFAINPECDYADKAITLNKYQLTAITTFSILFIIVILSTICELIEIYLIKRNKRKTSVDLFIQSFSCISNIRNIFFETKLVNNKFQFLDGIRAIVSCFLVYHHGILFSIFPFNSKSSKMSASYQLFNTRNYIFNKNMGLIDTFFFIGGMMVCYIMLSKLEKSKGRFNYIQYALFRYIRLIPISMAAIFALFIFPLVGSGPYWNMISNIMFIPCRNDWLSSILMTNNFDIDPPHKGFCNSASWYVPADYHLYLLAPIIFLMYHHHSKLVYIWSLIFIILGIIINIIPKVVFNIPYVLEKTGLTDTLYNTLDLVLIYYWRTDPHIVSYVFGMFCGFLIRQKPNIYFGGRVGEIFIWIITSVMTGATMYWSNYFWNYHNPLTYWNVVSFLAFSKLTYLCGWFWVFYACATGRGGFVNKFFSWNGFKPFSYLSFEVSLLHILPIAYRVGVSRSSVVYTFYYVITIACFDYLVTFLLSIIANLLVTAPFANLVDLFLKPKPKSPISPKENEPNQ